jgi:hypothetical protein
MENKELKKRVIQSLEAFEALEELQPSNQWNESLMKRLSSSKRRSTAKKTAGTVIVVITLLCLLNIGFGITILLTDTGQSEERKAGLEIISKELLINPSSVNN